MINAKPELCFRCANPARRQSGDIVTRWASQWERPELWIFDFHHHLFAGDNGEWVIGVAGLCGLFFVISGVILWWRTRKTFQFRLWPKRMSRPSIVWQHRDLGIIVAPLLLISIVTGTMMIFRPFALGVVEPDALSRDSAGLQRLEQLRLDRHQPIYVDTPLHDVLDLVASVPYPVPVLDHSGAFKGTISKNLLLQTLSRH